MGRSETIGQSNPPASVSEADCGSHYGLQEIQFSTNPGTSLVIPIRIKGIHTYAVVDTAAQVSIISEDVFRQIKHPLTVSEKKILLTGAAKNSKMEARKVSNLPLIIGNQTYNWDLLIAPIQDTFILGLDFLKAQSGLIDLKEDLLILGGHQIRAQMRKNNDQQYLVQKVILKRKTVVPPNIIHGP